MLNLRNKIRSDAGYKEIEMLVNLSLYSPNYYCELKQFGPN
jgi:hypothetical protein